MYGAEGMFIKFITGQKEEDEAGKLSNVMGWGDGSNGDSACFAC